MKFSKSTFRLSTESKKIGTNPLRILGFKNNEDKEVIEEFKNIKFLMMNQIFF